jgi:hypothetical protein
MLIGVLALPALPAAAQGKAIGRPAGVGKPASAAVKGPKTSGTPTKGKSADAQNGTLVKGNGGAAKSAAAKGRGQLPLGEKIALNGTLKTRLDALLAGGTMTYEQATTGWRNQGQLVAAMNAAEHNPGISFFDLHAKMTGPGQPSVGEALKELQPEAPPTTTTATGSTTTP